MKLLIRFLLAVITLYIAAWLSPGVELSLESSIIAAFILGILNIFVKPILKFFSLPFTILSFGLFLIVINTVIILLCSYLVDGFTITGFINPFIFSIIYSITNWIIGILFRR